VGLCQRGAVERARSGHSPQTIISHYYPGTSLRQYY
jgi:peptidoglycan hydrolase-like amidase